MSIQNVTLTDASAADHIFEPQSQSGNLTSYSEELGVPVSNPQLSISVRPPVNGNGVYKARVTFRRPYATVVDGVTKVDHSDEFYLDIMTSERALDTDVADSLAMFVSALAGGTLKTAIEQRRPIL